MSSNLADVKRLLTASYASLNEIEKANNGNTDFEKLGEKAMELISDYPLYVSGLSNITYAEAIGIAMLIYGDIEKEYEIEQAYPLYADYVKGFDKANGEPVCFNDWFDNEYQKIKKGK